MSPAAEALARKEHCRAMRITIITLGSRGDIQPFIALGAGLQRAGYTITLATPTPFEALVRSYGLNYAPVRFDPQEFIKLPEVQLLQRQPLRRMLEGRRVFAPIFERMFDDFWQASQGADAIIYYPCASGTQVGYDCAEKLGVPVIVASLQPSSPTRAFPSFYMPYLPQLGGTYNRLTHFLYERRLWWNIRGWLTPWRKRVLGLPPLPSGGPFPQLRAKRAPYLFGYSPLVIPKPSDWMPWQYVTGYWFLDAPADWQPPAALMQFLEAGPPPVYIGLGSTVIDDPAAFTKIALEALQRTGQRGILLAGWSELGADDLPDTVFRLDAAPFDWLFPRMAAIVHHGGAGTTSAALLAGVPSVFTPFDYDQGDWARLVVGLGVGVQAASIRQLNVDVLAAAIHTAISDQGLRARAAAFGEQIRAEDGVGQAVAIMKQYVPS
jgi:UDP:flavonoid glycosyltransferase YjiC (YdhE family)